MIEHKICFICNEEFFCCNSEPASLCDECNADSGIIDFDKWANALFEQKYLLQQKVAALTRKILNELPTKECVTVNQILSERLDAICEQHNLRYTEREILRVLLEADNKPHTTMEIASLAKNTQQSSVQSRISELHSRGCLERQRRKGVSKSLVRGKVPYEYSIVKKLIFHT
jgi:predicted transcriptional regulator